jgi:hypothetical protein
MHVNYVVMGKEPPALIDSALNLYLLEKLRSTKSGLWLIFRARRADRKLCQADLVPARVAHRRPA